MSLTERVAGFAQLLSEQFEDYQIFAGEGSRFEEDAQAFLTNPSVQGLLLTKVRATIQKDPDLSAIADHQAIAQIRSDLGRMAGLDPGFRLEEYRTRIRARYGYLRFDSFHVTGSDLERGVQLYKIFVPQYAKEDLPPLQGCAGAADFGTAG